jgi:hypothetical protein
MAITPEAIYLQLGQLVADMPDLATGPITREMNDWMGRAIALIELADPFAADIAALKIACRNLNSPIRALNAQAIASIVHQALAKAELRAPVGMRGAFIAAGHKFDAFSAVAEVLAMAKADVLMIDPYADAKALTHYAVLANENVSVRLLADAADYKASLKPAAEFWGQQHGALRPLEVRLAPAKTLHDRLIQLDGSTVWVLGQSFKDLATRSHTSLVRMDPDPAALKIAAYTHLWQVSTPL